MDGLKRMQELVESLGERTPDPERIQEKMRALGIPYSTDPIACMHAVLGALSEAPLKKPVTKSKPKTKRDDR